MLGAYLFDHKRGEAIDEWQSALHALHDGQVLWIDIHDSPSSERADLRRAFNLESDHPAEISGSSPGPSVRLHDGYVHVTAVTAPDEDASFGDPAQVLDSFVGGTGSSPATSATTP